MRSAQSLVLVTPETERPDPTLPLKETSFDRRAHARVGLDAVRGLRSARLKYGPALTIIDVSAGGALLEAPFPFRPESDLVLELQWDDAGTIVPSRVVRCQVSGLDGGLRYRGACAFRRPLDVPDLLIANQATAPSPSDFIKPDLALKGIVERYVSQPVGPSAATDEEARYRQLIDALETLQAASGKRAGAAEQRLSELLAQVIPALKRRDAASTIVSGLEDELRRAMPIIGLRVGGRVNATSHGSEVLAFNSWPMAGDPRAVNVEFPAGFGLNEPQFRLLKASAYLISLVQAALPIDPDAPAERDEPAEPEPLPDGWHRVIARFADGTLLRGYCNDFQPSRPQVCIWPELSAPPHERLFVPVGQLKALFFVRDFAGDPDRVDDESFDHAPKGRRIQITFRDGEVLVGSTFSYKPDGDGFFVAPANSRSNNLRVYVVAGAVRHTRLL